MKKKSQFYKFFPLNLLKTFDEQSENSKCDQRILTGNFQGGEKQKADLPVTVPALMHDFEQGAGCGVENRENLQRFKWTAPKCFQKCLNLF